MPLAFYGILVTDIIIKLNQGVQTVGGVLCHQLQERSLTMNGNLLPVCARCTGMYTGIVLCTLFLMLGRRFKGNPTVTVATGLLLSLGVSVMALDGLSSYAGLRDSNNTLRVYSGLLFGVSLAVLYVLALKTDVRKAYNRVVLSFAELMFLFFLASYAGKWLLQGNGSHGLAILVIVSGMVLIFAGAILLLYRVTTAARKRSRAEQKG